MGPVGIGPFFPSLDTPCLECVRNSHPAHRACWYLLCLHGLRDSMHVGLASTDPMCLLGFPEFTLVNCDASVETWGGSLWRVPILGLA